ncbi:MAG TPA: DJ-1/PfpI family protein [Pyrinomonadaceae bacterium]|nr:DJ-1/PfpI family protein [Pyrinomonadaceae bacterium]
MKKASLALTLLALIAAYVPPSCAQSQSPPAAKQKMNVAILIFDGVQIIDYTGPYEVLGSRRIRNVYTVAEKPDAITTNMGMRVVPNYTFQNQPKPDIMIIPGGSVKAHVENPNVIRWLQENAAQARYVMSVCNGAFFLAKAGLLDGLEATTTAGLIDNLRVAAPKTKIVTDRRFVDNGKIITAGGLSSGIDGALHLVELLDGKGWAQTTAYGIEYNWQPDAGFARASHADLKLPQSIYDAFYPGAEPISVGGGANNWEEKWDVSSTSTAAEMVKLVNEKWATDARWKQAEVSKAANAAANESRWKFTDEKGQAWDGIVSVQPVEKNKLLLTLKVVRSDSNASAQLK